MTGWKTQTIWVHISRIKKSDDFPANHQQGHRGENKFQQTPGTYPGGTPKYKNDNHKTGGLRGYVPGICWSFLRGCKEDLFLPEEIWYNCLSSKKKSWMLILPFFWVRDPRQNAGNNFIDTSLASQLCRLMVQKSGGLATVVVQKISKKMDPILYHTLQLSPNTPEPSMVGRWSGFLFGVQRSL